MNLKHLIARVGGLAVGLAAPLVAFAATNPFQAAQDSYLHPIATNAGIQSSATLTDIIGRIINIALSFMGIVLLFYVLWAGFKWMTSEGDKGAEEARKMIRNAVIGLVIIVSAYAISSFVMTSLVGVVGGA